MKFYSREIVEKARLARRGGLSLRSIEKKFKIPSSTLSKWVRDIKSDNIIYKKARVLESANINKYVNIFNNFIFRNEQLKVFASLLYWCEGSKYPSSNRLDFTNSDPRLIKTFLELLRSGFEIKEDKLRVRLQLHSSQNIKTESYYWSKTLNIPLKQFGKSTITNPNNKRKRLNYRGTCTIKYCDVKLLLQIKGIYEKFSTLIEEGCQSGNGAAC